MKKQFFALMVGAAVCATSPAFAMEVDPNDGGYDVEVYRSHQVIVNTHSDGSHDYTTGWHTEIERRYPFHLDKPAMSDEMFESLATTGLYQKGNKLYTVDDIGFTAAALAFYRENQNDNGELANEYHKQWLENNFESYKKREESSKIFKQGYPNAAWYASDYGDAMVDADGEEMPTNFEFEEGPKVYTGPAITMEDMERAYPTPKPIKFTYCLDGVPYEPNAAAHCLFRKIIEPNGAEQLIAAYRVEIKSTDLDHTFNESSIVVPTVNNASLEIKEVKADKPKFLTSVVANYVDWKDTQVDVKTDIGQNRYQLQSPLIPVHDSANFSIKFRVAIKQGGFAVGLLSRDSLKWESYRHYTKKANGPLIEDFIDLPPGSQEKNIYFLFCNPSLAEVSKFTIHNLVVNGDKKIGL